MSADRSVPSSVVPAVDPSRSTPQPTQPSDPASSARMTWNRKTHVLTVGGQRFTMQKGGILSRVEDR